MGLFKRKHKKVETGITDVKAENKNISKSFTPPTANMNLNAKVSSNPRPFIKTFVIVEIIFALSLLGVIIFLAFFRVTTIFKTSNITRQEETTEKSKSEIEQDNLNLIAKSP